MWGYWTTSLSTVSSFTCKTRRDTQMLAATARELFRTLVRGCRIELKQSHCAVELLCKNHQRTIEESLRLFLFAALQSLFSAVDEAPLHGGALFVTMHHVAPLLVWACFLCVFFKKQTDKQKQCVTFISAQASLNCGCLIYTLGGNAGLHKGVWIQYLAMAVTLQHWKINNMFLAIDQNRNVQSVTLSH